MAEQREVGTKFSGLWAEWACLLVLAPHNADSVPEWGSPATLLKALEPSCTQHDLLPSLLIILLPGLHG
jgi:hypothetical protein